MGTTVTDVVDQVVALVGLEAPEDFGLVEVRPHSYAGSTATATATATGTGAVAGAGATKTTTRRGGMTPTTGDRDLRYDEDEDEDEDETGYSYDVVEVDDRQEQRFTPLEAKARVGDILLSMMAHGEGELAAAPLEDAEAEAGAAGLGPGLGLGPRLVFRKRLFRVGDEEKSGVVFTDLCYRQIQAEYLEGQYPVDAETALELAVYQYLHDQHQYQHHGDPPPPHLSADVSTTGPTGVGAGDETTAHWVSVAERYVPTALRERVTPPPIPIPISRSSSGTTPTTDEEDKANEMGLRMRMGLTQPLPPSATTTTTTTTTTTMRTRTLHEGADSGSSSSWSMTMRWSETLRYAVAHFAQRHLPTWAPSPSPSPTTTTTTTTTTTMGTTLQRAFLRVVRALPYGAASFYAARRKDDPLGLLPEHMLVGVNYRGLHFFRTTPRAHLVSVELKDIVSYGSNSRHAHFKMRLAGQINLFSFVTTGGEELCRALQTHIHDGLALRSGGGGGGGHQNTGGRYRNTSSGGGSKSRRHTRNQYGEEDDEVLPTEAEAEAEAEVERDRRRRATESLEAALFAHDKVARALDRTQADLQTSLARVREYRERLRISEARVQDLEQQVGGVGSP